MVEDNDPREFFNSSWFEEICHLLGLNHEAVLSTVQEQVHGEQEAPSGGGDVERTLQPA